MAGVRPPKKKAALDFGLETDNAWAYATQSVAVLLPNAESCLHSLYSYSFAPGHTRGKGGGFTTLEEDEFVFDNLWKLTRWPIYGVHSLIFFAANSAPQLGSGVHCTQTCVQWDSSPLRPMQGESPRDRNVTMWRRGNSGRRGRTKPVFHLSYAYTRFYASTYNNFLLHMRKNLGIGGWLKSLRRETSLVLSKSIERFDLDKIALPNFEKKNRISKKKIKKRFFAVSLQFRRKTESKITSKKVKGS